METNEELKQMMAQNIALAEENNKILQKIRSVQKRETLWQITKIVVALLIAFGFFYYIEPYLDKMMSLYSSITGMEQKINASPLQDLLKKL